MVEFLFKPLILQKIISTSHEGKSYFNRFSFTLIRLYLFYPIPLGNKIHPICTFIQTQWIVTTIDPNRYDVRRRHTHVCLDDCRGGNATIIKSPTTWPSIFHIHRL